MERSDAEYHQQGAVPRSHRRVAVSVPTLVVAAVCLSVATHFIGAACMGRDPVPVMGRKFTSPTAALARSARARTGSRLNAETPSYTGWWGKGTLTEAERKAKAAERDAIVSTAFGETAGAVGPLGYWDPVEFWKAGKVDPKILRWFREAEIKHGRIAMLAAVGFLVGESPVGDALFPGQGSKLGIEAFNGGKHDGFWHIFTAAVAFHEFGFYKNFERGLTLQESVARNIAPEGNGDQRPGWGWALKDDYLPGDLKFDPLGVKPKDPAKLAEFRNKELQNGRLAMLALAGMNAQEFADHKPIFPVNSHGFNINVLGNKPESAWYFLKSPPASAAEMEQFESYVKSGFELAKEMGQMLQDTAQLAYEHQ